MLFTDQPPAYPYNDKPPDYHDVCPRKTVSPPPVDILPPDNTPAVHIPLSTTTTATSSVVESSDTTTTTSIAAATTTTRYPPENIVVTQPLSHNSHLNNVNNIEVSEIIVMYTCIPEVHICIYMCVCVIDEDTVSGCNCYVSGTVGWRILF